MKKLITILAIMIVLVGAVFAANSPKAQEAYGTAAIDVKAKVPEAIPQFQLAVASTEASKTAVVHADIANRVYNEGAGTYTPADPTTTRADSNLTAASVTSLSGGTNVTINFEINQIAAANLKAVYKITVTANHLDLQTFSDGTEVGNAFNATYHRFECSTLAPVVTADETVVTGLTKADDDANHLTVTYTGAAQVPATQKLGTFGVTWTGNNQAVAGDYKAAVQIEVTAV